MSPKPLLPAILAMAALSMTTLYAQQSAPPAGGARGGGRGGAQNAAKGIVPSMPGLYMVTGTGAYSMARVANEGESFW